MASNIYQNYTKWLVPLDERKLAPVWWFPGYLGICILSCIPPPDMKMLRIALAGPILLSMLLYTPNYTLGDSGADFAAGVFMAAVAVKWVDFVICRVPEEEFWRVPENKESSSPSAWKRNGTHPRADGPIWEKMRWSISLWCTDRGIGWNWKVKNLQDGVPSTYSRRRFVQHCIRRTLVAYLAIDACLAVLKTTAYGDAKRYTDPTLVKPDIYKEEIVTRTIVVWLVAIESYHSLHMPYYLLGAITTAFGICRPEQWPALFGSYREDAWSVRNMWGKVWHQEIRKTISAPTEWVCFKILHLPRGTLWSRYGQLIFGFLFSSICHCGGTYLVHRHSAGMFSLWMSQAVIIMVEDFAIYLGRKAGFRKNCYTKLIGVIWSVIWFSMPRSIVTASNVVLEVGHPAFNPPPAGSVMAIFQVCKGCESLWQVLLDRSVVFLVLTRVLNVLEVDNWNDLLASGPSIAGIMALHVSNSRPNDILSMVIKSAAASFSFVDVLVKGV